MKTFVIEGSWIQILPLPLTGLLLSVIFLGFSNLILLVDEIGSVIKKLTR